MLIHCPRCNKKVAEQEIKVGDNVRFWCENCKKPFWVVGELKTKELVEYEEK